MLGRRNTSLDLHGPSCASGPGQRILPEARLLSLALGLSRTPGGRRAVDGSSDRVAEPLLTFHPAPSAEGRAGANGNKSHASAPGSEPIASARPKHTENSSALSAATP